MYTYFSFFLRMILFNYLAAVGKDVGLCAGMCISVLWNLLESANSMEKPLNQLFYNRFLARSLVKKVERYQNTEYRLLYSFHYGKSLCQLAHKNHIKAIKNE